jgi:glycosyltransferase involved in cell wall biosynthesis
MTYVLSIGIPVYNGELTIGDTIASVVSQLEPGVEVIVSDNASTDKTREVVEEYQLGAIPIRYFRNDTNLGFDANVDLVVRRSLGRYVWLLGDDDEIAGGGIKLVLEKIANHDKLAAIFVNYSLHDRLANKLIKERALAAYSDVYCENSDSFLSHVSIYPNFISSIVLRRSIWLRLDPERFYGSKWIHFIMLLQIVQGHPSCIVSFPYVLNKGIEYAEANDANRGGVALGLLLDLNDILDSLSPEFYSKISLVKAKNEAYRFVPRKIMSSRLRGLTLTLTILRRLHAHYGDKLLFWLRDIPLFLLPKHVYRLIYFFYKSRLVSLILRGGSPSLCSDLVSESLLKK